MLDLVALALTAYMLKDEIKFDASTLKMSSLAKMAVKLGEGFHLDVKVIPGESVHQYTVGWGSTSANHSTIRPGAKFSASVLEKMLDQDLKIREIFIQTELKGVKITQGVFDALVSAKYNANQLLTKESPNFNRLIKSGDLEAARKELDFWNDPGHINHKGLAKRRMLEHCLWLGLPLPDKQTYDKVFQPRALEFARTKDPALLKF